MLAETAKLHAGDAENRRLWQEVHALLPEDEIQRIYAASDVRFDHTLGESFYHDHARRASCRRAAAPGHRPARATGGGRACSSEGQNGADDRAEAGRGLSLRHDRPGHDPLSHGALAARTRFCTWSIIARACISSSFSPPRGCWATTRSSCSTSASAPCWATTAGRSRPARATPSAWRACWTRPCAGPLEIVARQRRRQARRGRAFGRQRRQRRRERWALAP